MRVHSTTIPAVANIGVPRPAEAPTKAALSITGGTLVTVRPPWPEVVEKSRLSRRFEVVIRVGAWVSEGETKCRGRGKMIEEEGMGKP